MARTIADRRIDPDVASRFVASAVPSGDQIAVRQLSQRRTVYERCLCRREEFILKKNSGFIAALRRKNKSRRMPARAKRRGRCGEEQRSANEQSAIQRLPILEARAVRNLPRACRHPVVLPVPELALGDWRPDIVEIPAIKADLTAAEAIADSATPGRVRRRDGCVAFVEEAVADIVHGDVRVQAVLLRKDDTGAEEVEGRHLETLAGELCQRAVEVL